MSAEDFVSLKTDVMLELGKFRRMFDYFGWLKARDMIDATIIEIKSIQSEQLHRISKRG